jgi:hypothetical protein
VTPWILVDQRSVADALSLTPLPAPRPLRVYNNVGIAVQIQSERAYNNRRNMQLGCPAALIVSISIVLKYFRINMEWSAQFHRHILPITYLASIALGLVLLNGGYTKPSQSGVWIAVILIYTYLFGTAQAILIACIPRRTKREFRESNQLKDLAFGIPGPIHRP